MVSTKPIDVASSMFPVNKNATEKVAKVAPNR